MLDNSKENVHFYELKERNGQILLGLEIPGLILWYCVFYQDDLGGTEFAISCMVKRVDTGQRMVGSGQHYVVTRVHMIIFAKYFVKMVFSIDCEIFDNFFGSFFLILIQPVQSF